MPETAALGHNAAGLVDVVKNGVLLSAGVTSGIEDMAGHKNCHRLRTHQIGIKLDIGREDGRDLILDGALQL